MLNSKAFVLAASLLLHAAAPSHAAMMSAQDLLNACAGGGAARATCDGYLMAITDVISRRESSGAAKVCVPPSVSVDQVRDAVLSTGQRPRVSQAPNALRLVGVAMRVSWPCQSGQGNFSGPGNLGGPRAYGGPGNFRGQGGFGGPNNFRGNEPDIE